MRDKPYVAFVWMPLLCLCAIALTVAGMLTFVTPERPDDYHPTEWRPPAFWAEMVAMCLAEVVFFAYLAYAFAAGRAAGGPSAQVRNRILALILVWLILVILSGSVAVNFPGSFFGDKIVFLQLIVTFVLFLMAFLFHRQSASVEAVQAAPHQERVALQSYAGGVDVLRNSVLGLAGLRADAGGELDRLAKRLDTLKTQLQSASPTAEREEGRAFNPVSVAEVENRLRALRDQVRRMEQAEDESFPDAMASVRQTVDGLLAALRQREDVLTF